jgi:hypothetical protein
MILFDIMLKKHDFTQDDEDMTVLRRHYVEGTYVEVKFRD